MPAHIGAGVVPSRLTASARDSSECSRPADAACARIAMASVAGLLTFRPARAARRQAQPPPAGGRARCVRRPRPYAMTRWRDCRRRGRACRQIGEPLARASLRDPQRAARLPEQQCVDPALGWVAISDGCGDSLPLAAFAGCRTCAASTRRWDSSPRPSKARSPGQRGPRSTTGSPEQILKRRDAVARPAVVTCRFRLRLPGCASAFAPPCSRRAGRQMAHVAQTCLPVIGLRCITRDVRQEWQRRPP